MYSNEPTSFTLRFVSWWLDQNAVDKIENRQTHKVEGYFMNSDTTVSGGKGNN